MHYLDNAATTPVLPEAAEAAKDIMLHNFGNPSSAHRLGIEAAKELARCRNVVAGAMSATSDEVIFTSCGTESINTAVRAVAHLNRHRKGHVITTLLEHAAVKQSFEWLRAEGFAVTYLQPDGQGHIAPQTLLQALQEDTVFFSCQLINNEIGTIQDIEALGKAFKQTCPKALFHVDAVQGLLKSQLAPRRWNCDFMSVSGHKIGAPKGVGALFHKKGLRMPALLHGGGQEQGLRSGTEALPNIAAFAKACEVQLAHMQESNAHIAALAAYLKEQMEIALPYAYTNVISDVPHIQNISVPGCKSEVMMRVLESENVFVSSGSACSKGKQSGVLKAIGLPKERSDSALRISFAPYNTTQDIDALICAIQKGAAMLRR